MLTCEPKPNTYRSRVDWYASHDCHSVPIEVYRTKAEAVTAAKRMLAEKSTRCGVYSVTPYLAFVGWIPVDASYTAITTTREVIDYRN